MKKSSTFMLAYIIFLFVSVGVSLCTEWDGIEKISVAATMAGYFFALADLMGWTQTTQVPAILTKIDEYEALAQCYQNDIESYHAALDEIRQAMKYLAKHKNKSKKINEMYATYVEVLSDMEKIENEEPQKDLHIAKTCKRHAKLRKRLKYLQPSADILFTLGFLDFLVILVFDDYMQRMLPHAEIFTILAFAIIMFTYFLKDILDEKYEKQIESSKKAIAKYREELSEPKLKISLFESMKQEVDEILQQEEESNGQTENAQCE